MRIIASSGVSLDEATSTTSQAEVLAGSNRYITVQVIGTCCSVERTDTTLCKVAAGLGVTSDAT